VEHADMIATVLGGNEQTDWRDDINRAKADHPNLNMRDAAVLAVGRAIAEALEG